MVFLLYEALQRDQTPPDLNFRIVSITPVSGGYLVQFDAYNTGNKTAAKLKLTASLTKGNDVIETRDATLDYAPANSVRHAGVFFSHDPRQYGIHISAEGYASP
jgi:uncharacterized protein (TIGR02588 family)